MVAEQYLSSVEIKKNDELKPLIFVHKSWFEGRYKLCLISSLLNKCTFSINSSNYCRGLE